MDDMTMSEAIKHVYFAECSWLANFRAVFHASTVVVIYLL
jgi:hypothetical protein